MEMTLVKDGEQWCAMDIRKALGYRNRPKNALWGIIDSGADNYLVSWGGEYFRIRSTRTSKAENNMQMKVKMQRKKTKKKTEVENT